MKKCIFKKAGIDCDVIRSDLANYYTGIVTAGGNLLLTNNSLIFEGHALNVGRKYACIPLKDITDVQLTTKICKLQHLLITTSEETHKFAVTNADEWKESIQKAIAK